VSDRALSGRYTARDLAAIAGVSPRMIRYWRTDLKLVPPPVGKGRGARYTEDHLDRIRVIVACRAKNKTLRDVAREARAAYPYAFERRRTA
jgi:DNA-binding transcriptional MerR regulator